MAIVLDRFEKFGGRVIDAINQLIQGRSNAVVKDIVVRANQTTTTVMAPNCSKDCIVFPMPQDSGARAEYDPATVYADPVGQGFFVLNHPSSAGVRTYSFLAIGG